MTTTLNIEAKHVWDQADCLFDSGTLSLAIDQMAIEISRDFADKDPVILCIMNGGLILTGHLLTRLPFNLRVDYVHATRYRNKTEGGELNWLKKHILDLRNEHVIIIDDILDEGVTLHHVVDAIAQEQPASIASAVLCKKDHQRNNGFEADYVGVTVPDRYVFGYGMDYKGYLRNANGIYAVSE